MSLFKRYKQQKCEAPNCSNDLPERPAIVVLGDEYELRLCEECERFFEVLSEKMEELLDEQYKSI